MKKLHTMLQKRTTKKEKQKEDRKNPRRVSIKRKKLRKTCLKKILPFFDNRPMNLKKKLNSKLNKLVLIKFVDF